MTCPDPNKAPIAEETYDTLRARIRNRYDSLSPHLQRIARSALDEPNHFALNTVSALAEHVGVQPSTLIRFAKEFDFGGFSQLQRIFRLRLIEGAPDKREQVYEQRLAQSNPADMKRLFEGCIDDSIESLKQVRESTDIEDLARAVSLIKFASHVHIAGLRRARPIATYLAYGISRNEKHCSLLDFGGGMAEQQIVNMAQNDLLICVSFPPYTSSVLDVARDAHLRKRDIIAITDTADSPLAKNSSIYFEVEHIISGQFKPISGAIALVQSLIVGMTV